MAKKKAPAKGLTSTTQLPVGVGGFEPILESQVDANLKKTETNAPVFTNEAAALLVWKDYQTARSYMDNNEWLTQWDQNDKLYQSPTIGGSADGRFAKVSRFTVNNDTNTMADAVKQGLFSQKPCFFLRPRGKTRQIEVKAWTALLDALLDRMKFQYWTGLGIDSQTLDGTGIWKGGWSTRKVIKKSRKLKNPPPEVDMPEGEPLKPKTKEMFETEEVTDKVTESYPWLQNRILGTTLFDPGWRTPNKPDECGYAIDYDYPTWLDLARMRDDPDSPYDIPDEEALKKWFFTNLDDPAPEAGTQAERDISSQSSMVLHAEERSRPTTADPLSHPILMMERWDADRCMAVLRMNGTNLTIRNDEHQIGRIPHFTANWRNIKNTGWGMGIGKLVGGDQRIEQGVLNHALNLLGYQLNPVVLHAMGANVATQNREVRAGGFMAVQPPADGDVRKAMAVMQMPEVPAEAWRMIQYSKQSGNETSGADATFMQGNLGGPKSSAARTATGAGRIAMKADGKVQTPVENIEQGLIIPWIEMLIDFVKRLMPLEEIDQILEEKLSIEIFKSINYDTFLSASMTVEALAGAKLAAKAAMAQQLPFLMQIFQQPQLLEQLHQEGRTVDFAAIIDVLFQVSEFRNEKDIIRDLTPEEMQTIMKMNQGQQKTNETVVEKQLEGQNQLALSDRNAQNEVAVTAAEHALEAHSGGGDPTGKNKTPVTRAAGLVERKIAQDAFSGQGPSPLAGVAQ